MKIKFWGVRGSIPSPGTNTARYGGNTTCIEIRTDDNELIILDGGTGIFALSQALLGEMPLTANVFITHAHWDHIQGLPFFIPIFIPGNTLRLHGAFDPVSGCGIERIMEVQMQYSYFPVREAEMKANIEYETLMPEQSVRVGSATITPTLLNHPVINFGYRIDCNGKSVFFTGDHESYYNIYAPDDEGYGEYQALIEAKEKSIIEAMRGVDVLIVDSSYTVEEYPAKKGWGHGTLDSSIALAKKAGAGIVYCTHHEPTRSDEALEREFEKALARNPVQDGGPECRLAREGEEILL
ncbi:MAG: MBL fold metallo-hydrolase [Gallionellales bacterium RIFCSPLOWO2_12_FULL_59_22]|nr:MAG: MBL fold metallo-hydrolase [Gallionellales bacterium RIFCSPLOWO2_02_FULL_59_110]OGT05474.1 MAG: MBL fold metallo-hydrolase [Gallionellales bacterium RIFCSPLOWO2_02_58_13]OGT14589.1 MAG: MBL fold metallo-hydrolase [Gallionellales bacterium RIFCSPLOWO2_12_FULL_59_22]